MKHNIQNLLKQSLVALAEAGVVSEDTIPQTIAVDTPRRDGQGDYATGLALSIARHAGMKPRDLAAHIAEHVPQTEYIEKIEVAGPGFVNFFLSKRALTAIVEDILSQGSRFGICQAPEPQRILVEFVSANPTGPLHVGHGRGTTFGDVLARILRAAGNIVETEYYVNDIGRQMDILCVSVWLRYLEIRNESVEFPGGAYQGDYIVECAHKLSETQGSGLVRSFDGPVLSDNTTVDQHLTEWIQVARDELKDRFLTVRQFVLDYMVDVIRDDLAALGVHHDRWFFESQLSDKGEVEKTVSLLRQNDRLYREQGATWFRSSDFGDEKDRVLVRSNGELTYFASDIAYHLDKYNRGYNQIINIWGADHHGYVARMKAALEAASEDSSRLEILIVQLASLNRAGQKVSMSTRAGEFVTLRELVDETGQDAVRFFYLLRKCEQHLDFDLELAKEQSSDNPVYYIQYAHARILSVFRQMSKRGVEVSAAAMQDHVYTSDSEAALIKRLAQYPQVIESAARNREPHQVAYYLKDVATDFHSFYNRERILDCDEPVRSARLNLIDTVRQVLANGLDVMGISAPQTM